MKFQGVFKNSFEVLKVNGGVCYSTCQLGIFPSIDWWLGIWNPGWRGFMVCFWVIPVHTVCLSLPAWARWWSRWVGGPRRGLRTARRSGKSAQRERWAWNGCWRGCCRTGRRSSARGCARSGTRRWRIRCWWSRRRHRHSHGKICSNKNAGALY